jgi:hypothetical protein
VQIACRSSVRSGRGLNRKSGEDGVRQLPAGSDHSPDKILWRAAQLFEMVSQFLFLNRLARGAPFWCCVNFPGSEFRPEGWWCDAGCFLLIPTDLLRLREDPGGAANRPPGLAHLQPSYYDRSRRTDCGWELACANIAVPAWTRML